MSHQIEKMFFAGKTPWHGLGVGVEKEQTSEDAIRLANLDWKVKTEPIYNMVGDKAVTIKGYRGTVRSTDSKVLGVVSDRYCPIQNGEAFSFLDSVVGEGNAVYHTAGSLDGGRKVWVLAKLPGDMVVPGVKDDVIERYLLLSNSHDGTNALRALATGVRCVCSNTINMALRAGRGEGVSIRHTANAGVKLEEAKKAFAYATKYFDAMKEVAALLASTKYTDKQRINLTEVLFPVKEGEDVPTRTANNRALLLNLFENGRGMEKIRGSAWAALNGATELVSHHRGTRVTSGADETESKMNAIMFGSGKALAQKAFNQIAQDVGLEVAA